MLKKATLFIDNSVSEFLKNHGHELARSIRGLQVHAAIARFLMVESLQSGFQSHMADLPLGITGQVGALSYREVMLGMVQRADRLESVLKVDQEGARVHLEVSFYGKGKGKPLRRLNVSLGSRNIMALQFADVELLGSIKPRLSRTSKPSETICKPRCLIG